VGEAVFVEGPPDGRQLDSDETVAIP